MATVSLVIPAFNEEKRLPELLAVLAGSADRAVSAAGFELLEALIVDDGSTDGTGRILEQARASNPKLQPVSDYPGNRGKGAAFAAGVRHASGDYVLLADVDLSTPLEELHKLAGPIRRGADVAIGSRAIEGAVVERGPIHRKVLGKTFNGTVRALTGLDVRDTQCGFKLMPTPLAELLVREQICPGFAFDVELLMRADLAGMRIEEVPVLYLHDARSSVRVGSASVAMLRDVCRLSYQLRVRRRGAGRPAAASQAR